MIQFLLFSHIHILPHPTPHTHIHTPGYSNISAQRGVKGGGGALHLVPFEKGGGRALLEGSQVSLIADPKLQGVSHW